MAHEEIKKRGIGKELLDSYYKENLSVDKIATKYDISRNQVRRYLTDEKLKNYNDEKLEALSLSEEVSPLNVITNFFQGVQHAQKEMAFTAILNERYREKIAAIMDAEGGIESLTKGENYAILSQWYTNSAKLAKLVEASQKHLEGYINLFNQVLDVQREVSFVKVVTEILRREDPALYRRIQGALDADPEAKLVLEALSREDVVFYWDSKLGKVAALEHGEVPS